MLEGLLILGIGAAIIIVAIFGTSIMATIGAISASITAMVTGAITGTATLLTSWISWVLAADATTFYLGYIWFAGWIALFTYSAFKIATSDKKKWMNLVGRGSNYLGIILILFLVAQPLAISYGSAIMADTTGYSLVEYNLQDSIGATANMPKTNVYNGSSNTVTQTELYNDDNDTAIISSLDFADYAGTITAIDIYTYLNATMLASTMVTKIVVSWTYLGTGNLTNIYISSWMDIEGDSVAKWKEGTGADVPSDIANTGTWTISPEIFQQYQIKSFAACAIYFQFTDTSNKPSDTDYFEFSIKFYETSTVFSQETIMLWLGASMAALDIMGLLYASGFLSKYIL